MPGKPFGLAVKAVLLDDRGRCLLIRRSAASKHFRGKWDMPGGKVDPGEPFDAALLREVEEETGLAARLTGVAGATEYEMEKVRVCILFMEARTEPGEVRLSDEHDAFDWVPVRDLVKSDLSDQLKAFAAGYVASPGNADAAP